MRLPRFAFGYARNDGVANTRMFARIGISDYTVDCQVTMSWGHDEYMYGIAKDFLPEPALYMIRYHSFYAAHREGAYGHLMNDRDREMFKWVKAFNAYDLYSKADSAPKINELKPYYQELIAEYFPETVMW